MKRRTGFILFLLFTVLCAFALADVAIDEDSFPDDIFRAWVIENCDQDSDGSLSDGEIAAVTIIDVAEKDIASLEGVEQFSALTELICYSNQLTELDVSKNTALTGLGCFSNQLTKLDISRNTELISLGCGTNKLTRLDVSKNTKLKYLYCNSNRLTKLDVSRNTELTGLHCEFNQLTELDISGIPILKDLVKNTEPGEAEHGYLVWAAGDNGHGLAEKDLSADKDVRIITDEPEKINIDTGNFPDETFRAYVQENFDTDGDSRLSDSEANAVMEISVGEMGITSLRGIEFFPNLGILWCDSNQLGELDVSRNTNLWGLYCFGNKLAALDVSNCTNLAELFCAENQLTKLDLSKNRALLNLWCSNNNLGALDVSNCPDLQYLSCDNTGLSSLDVSKNADLSDLVCYSNSITRLDVSNSPTICEYVWNNSRKKHNDPVCDCWTGEAGCDIWVDSTVTVIAGDIVSEPEKADISKAKISTIKDQVYSGKAIKPAFTVKLGKTKLSEETDYKVTWKNNTKIGTATVTVTGKGNYTGTVKTTFKINPKPVAISSLTAGSKKLTVKWDKGSGITGYEIQYSLKKNFSSKKTVNITKAKTTSKEIKSLKKGKTYYVRIRTYKTVKGTKYYSAWSKTLKAKVK